MGEHIHSIGVDFLELTCHVDHLGVLLHLLIFTSCVSTLHLINEACLSWPGGASTIKESLRCMIHVLIYMQYICHFTRLSKNKIITAR